MHRTFAVAFATLLSINLGLLWGQPRQSTLNWSELSSLTNEKVAMALPDGTYVEGKMAAVEADGLRLIVSKTSDRKAVPKGEQLIPRSSVSVLQVKGRRVLFRPLCALGAAAATAAVVLSGTSDAYEGPLVIIRPTVAVTGSIGMGVAGYYIGRRLDRTVTEIRVEREARVSPAGGPAQ